MNSEELRNKVEELRDKAKADAHNQALSGAERGEAIESAKMACYDRVLALLTAPRAVEGIYDRFKRLSGSDLTNNPASDVEFIKQVHMIYMDGFEAAHTLRRCGHSVGDYRDPDYIPGKPETYTASKSCIACEREGIIRSNPDISSEELTGILHGIADVKAGRTKSLEQIRAERLNTQAAICSQSDPLGRTMISDMPPTTWEVPPESPNDLRDESAHRADSPKPTSADQQMSPAQEALCGTAEHVTTSMNEAFRHTAIIAEDSGAPLLPEAEWNALTNESKVKLRKWFDLSVERLQMILDEPTSAASSAGGAS